MSLGEHAREQLGIALITFPRGLGNRLDFLRMRERRT
jgi:hypothetical protein